MKDHEEDDRQAEQDEHSLNQAPYDVRSHTLSPAPFTASSWPKTVNSGYHNQPYSKLRSACNTLKRHRRMVPPIRNNALPSSRGHLSRERAQRFLRFRRVKDVQCPP